VAGIGPVLAAVTPSLINAVAGVIAGGLVLAGVTAVSALLRLVKSGK
jgi:predicted DNA repair protein MutK